MARYLLEEQPVGNVVGSQESRHQVGDGPSLAAVRPEQECAQTSFPVEQVRQALGQQDPWSTLRRTPQARPAPLTQGLLQGRQ